MRKHPGKSDHLRQIYYAAGDSASPETSLMRPARSSHGVAVCDVAAAPCDPGARVTKEKDKEEQEKVPRPAQNVIRASDTFTPEFEVEHVV